MKRQFSSEELWRYLDGEAELSLRRDVLAEKDDPQLARRLESARALSERYRALPELSFGEAEVAGLLGRLRQEDHAPARRVGGSLGRWAAVAASILLAGVIVGGWQLLRGPEIGRWTVVEGPATIYRADGRWTAQPAPRTPLYRHDRLVLGSRARVKLALHDGSRVELEGPADFACAAWSEEARDFQMPYGYARYEVEHDSDRPFRVHVDRETITVTGTRFIVRAER